LGDKLVERLREHRFWQLRLHNIVHYLAELTEHGELPRSLKGKREGSEPAQSVVDRLWPSDNASVDVSQVLDKDVILEKIVRGISHLTKHGTERG